MNHAYSREERARLKEVESIDYLPPNSAVYRRWLAGQPHRCRSTLTWKTGMYLAVLPAEHTDRPHALWCHVSSLQ